MANYRVVTSEDVSRFGKLLGGKKEGDTITAAESYELDQKLKKHNGEKDTPPDVVTPEGVAPVEDDSEASETVRTRKARSSK